MRWVFEDFPPYSFEVEEVIQSFKLSSTIQHLLHRYSFRTTTEVYQFLNPSLKNVEAPEKIQHLEEAVEAVDVSCKTGQRIAILSDYDVDGITSSALMQRCFQSLNYTFSHFSPDRETEGYGLTEKVVSRILKNSSFDLLIALDCGTNSVEPIQQLKQAGISTIVLDHHQKNRETLPDAVIVNPHLNEEKHSIAAQELCSVGLVFKFIHAWVKRLKKEGYAPALNLKMKPYLDLVALGTIADMVPIQHENRLWVYFGLKELSKHNLGLQKLLEVSGCALDETLSPEDVSFKIAPRINASGRLASAELPYQLLSSYDAFLCESLANQLDQLNGERQAIEHRITQEAESMILQYPEKKVHVLFKPHWHIGVVGIVAGKLTRKWHRPIFVLGDKEGVCKGSGRSIPEINLVPMLTQAQALLKQWGGHPAAVGLSMDSDNIAPLEDTFNAYLDQLFPKYFPEPTLRLSAELKLDDVTPQFLSELERLGPFGQENEAPIFLVKQVNLPKPTEFFGKHKAHLRFYLKDIEVIGWYMASAWVTSSPCLDLAVRFSTFPPKPLRMQLLDIRPANLF